MLVLTTNSNESAGTGRQNTTTYIPMTRTTADAVSIKSNRNTHLSSQQVSTIGAITTENNTSAEAANIHYCPTTSSILGMTTPANTNLTIVSSVGTTMQPLASTVTKQQALTSRFNFNTYSEIQSTDTTQENFSLSLVTQVSAETTEQSTILPSASHIQPTLSNAEETVSHSTSLLQDHTGKGKVSGHADSATVPTFTTRHTSTSQKNVDFTTIVTVINDNTSLTETAALQSIQNDEMSTKVYTNASKFAPAVGHFESPVNIPAIATVVAVMIGALVLAGLYCVMHKLCFTPVR